MYGNVHIIAIVSAITDLIRNKNQSGYESLNLANVLSVNSHNFNASDVRF